MTVASAVLAVLVVAALATPAGRSVLVGLARSAARCPGLIRAELRGAAPLRVDGDPAARGDTTPDIPVVTRGLPVVERPDRR